MAISLGDQLGQYRIESILGHGGMASVYKAYHAKLNRYVAIKVIHAGSDAAFIARFEREARIIAQLDHPHIVTVYDFAEHTGQPYLVMKLIEGATLKTLLAQGALKPDDILSVMAPIASALDYAHQQGVLHRDIKPSNILLDKQATPYLADFGLARLTDNPESTISEGMLLGTPHYISPEQVIGGKIDHRADLYSLGVVLYEMFVGTVPFREGTPYTILQDHVTRELPPPRAANPSIPESVESVLVRATAKDPADRYPSAKVMIQALANAVGAENGALNTLLTANRFAVADSSTNSASFTPHHSASASHTAAKLAVQGTTRRSPKARRATTPWLWAGLALTVFCITGMILLLNSLAESGSEAQATIPAVTTQPSLTPIPRLPVNVVGLVGAQVLRRRNPTDPIAYLTLARAQFLNETDTAAGETIRQGLVYADNPVVYLMTASDLALQTHRYGAAVVAYITVLTYSENRPEYPAVRAEVGEILYRLASEAQDITAAQVREFGNQLQQGGSPVAVAVLAKALVDHDADRVAETVLGLALARDSTLAEAHLVLGELRWNQAHPDQAREEWLLARDAADAPEWVRNQAQQFLTEHAQP